MEAHELRAGQWRGRGKRPRGSESREEAHCGLQLSGGRPEGEARHAGQSFKQSKNGRLESHG